MAIARKENNVERVKRELDALDCLPDLLRYAKDGFAAIPEDDLNVRLRWYGLYTQRPHEDGLFMLRTKIPNGTLTAEQLESLGNLSVSFGRNTGDITTRQDIQFHCVRIEDVPEIFVELQRIGLSTSGACGDIARNVTGCPLAGFAADEFIDAEPFVRQVNQYFHDNREFSNLPRKFKITISGCAEYCTGHEINDIGLVALKNTRGETVFDLWVGGGLGAKERFAERLGAHVRAEEIVEICHHICAIFRDYGNRDSRAKARLKFLLADWGAEKFRTELEKRLERKLTDGEAPKVPINANRAHIGIHPQKTRGLFYVGAATKRGLFSGEEMIAVARLAQKYGGRFRLTPTQNFVVLDVAENNCEKLAAELSALDFAVAPSAFRTGTIACTGKEFCKLAVAETKGRAAEIIDYLERVFPDFAAPLRISVTGCPNSCAHYQVCDIGLVGDFVNTPAGKEDAFRVYLGGHLGEGYRFGRKLNLKVPAREINSYLAGLVKIFLARRLDDAETFQAFLKRHTDEELELLGAFETKGAAA